MLQIGPQKRKPFPTAALKIFPMKGAKHFPSTILPAAFLIWLLWRESEWANGPANNASRSPLYLGTLTCSSPACLLLFPVRPGAGRALGLGAFVFQLLSNGCLKQGKVVWVAVSLLLTS